MTTEIQAAAAELARQAMERFPGDTRVRRSLDSLISAIDEFEADQARRPTYRVKLLRFDHVGAALVRMRARGIIAGGFDHATGWFPNCTVEGDVEALGDEFIVIPDPPGVTRALATGGTHPAVRDTYAYDVVAGQPRAYVWRKFAGGKPDDCACDQPEVCDAESLCHYTGSPLVSPESFGEFDRREGTGRRVMPAAVDPERRHRGERRVVKMDSRLDSHPLRRFAVERRKAS